MKKNRYSKLFIAIFYVFCLIFTTNCKNNETKMQNIQSTTQEKLPDQICYNLDIAFIDSSNTKATVKAKRAKVFADSNKTFLDSGVFVQFFNEFGKKTGNLTAKNVEINDLTKDMFATGNVVVISDSSKTKLQTNELEWKNNTKKIYSNVYVKITSPNEIIEGFGLESDEKLNNYKIFKVTGIKQ